MKTVGIFLSLFGVIVILYPEFLAYLIGGFFLFLGLNIVLFNLGLNNFTKKNTDTKGAFFKIGKYKIYK